MPIPLHKTQLEMNQITQHETRFTKNDKRESEQWPGAHQYRKTVSKQNTLNTEKKKGLNTEFSRKEAQMGEKQLKKISTSLAIKERQIKTAVSLHLITIRIAD